MQQQSTEKDSPESSLYNQASENCQTSLFSDCQYQMSLSQAVLALISPWLEKEPGLKEFAVSSFLSSSECYDYSSLRVLSLKMSKESSTSTKAKHFRRSSNRLDNWGIAAPGKLGTAIGLFPKTDADFSVWAYTGNVWSESAYSTRKSLASCIDGTAIVYRSGEGDRYYEDFAPCVRSPGVTNGKQAGNGAYKVVGFDGKLRPVKATEVEKLMGWEEHSTAFGMTEDGTIISIPTTHRIKALGNGIIPAEISEILGNIAPLLTQYKQRKLSKESNSEDS